RPTCRRVLLHRDGKLRSRLAVRYKQSSRIRRGALHLSTDENARRDLPLFHSEIARFAHCVRAILWRELRRRAHVPLNALIFLSERCPYIYVAKSRRRSPMPRAHRLHRLPFAAIRRAPKRPIILRTNRVARIPELRRNAAVARVLQHSRFFAAFNLPGNFRRELKL